MNIYESHEKLRMDLRDNKEEWVEEHPDDPDMPSTIVFFRDEDPVAMVTVTNDRDTILNVLHMGCYGFSASAVSFSMEALSAKTEENPYTGKPWEAGDMSVISANYPEAFENGVLAECYAVSSYDREGHYVHTTDNFYRKGGEVVWTDEMIYSTEVESDTSYGGYIHDTLLEILGKSTMILDAEEQLSSGGLPTKFFGLDLDPTSVTATVAMDMTTLSVMYGKNMIIIGSLSAAPGSARAEQIEARKDSLQRMVEKELGSSVTLTTYDPTAPTDS